MRSRDSRRLRVTATRRVTVTDNRQGPAAIEFPNDLDIVLTREFDAPIQLVFDVATRPEHVRKTFAPFGETVTVCEIDLRAGGDYRFVMVTGDGTECAFGGTFLAVEPPFRTAQTWRFEGWPGVEAVESMDLRTRGGLTAMTYRLAFRDQAGRDHMTKYDGLLANFDHTEALLRSLQTQQLQPNRSP
jgi:uncharacterized protein YndB with AHSA1/START domain